MVTLFFLWIPASFSAQDVSPLGMNWGCAVKKAVVCGTQASFLEDVERCTLSEAGDFRKKKDSLLVKAIESFNWSM